MNEDDAATIAGSVGCGGVSLFAVLSVSGAPGTSRARMRSPLRAFATVGTPTLSTVGATGPVDPVEYDALRILQSSPRSVRT